MSWCIPWVVKIVTYKKCLRGAICVDKLLSFVKLTQSSSPPKIHVLLCWSASPSQVLADTCRGLWRMKIRKSYAVISLLKTVKFLNHWDNISIQVGISGSPVWFRLLLLAVGKVETQELLWVLQFFRQHFLTSVGVAKNDVIIRFRV